METVGDLLYCYRQRRDMTQADLAVRLGVSQKQVSAWESEMAVPGRNIEAAIRKMLGVDVGDYASARNDGLNLRAMRQTEDGVRRQQQLRRAT